MGERFAVQIEGRDLELSNLDKLMYPAAGFTKGEVVDYYTRIAPVLLPHLRGRALTRIRYPNGVDGAHFFEKNAPGGTPPWVRLATLPVPGSTKARETIDFVVVDDGLTAHPKTSGKKGMQLCVPIAGTQDAEIVAEYARQVAEELSAWVPGSITAQMARAVRPGKVFIDWSQNSAAKTTVAPYSLRAMERPTASTPLTWDEVGEMALGSVPARQFGATEVLARVELHGDLLAELLEPGPPVPAPR
jgi:bifunctional non-homologous end joining protein LigD